MSYPLAPRDTAYEIPYGDRGVDATVKVMRVLAREGAAEPDVRELVEDRIAFLGRGPETARAIREWLDEHVAFEWDPPGTELVRTPARMLTEIAQEGSTVGDCDDVATLGAALGLAAGLRPRFRLLGFHPGAPYSHVYTELYAGHGEWLDLDTTAPDQMPAGITVHRDTVREV